MSGRIFRRTRQRGRGIAGDLVKALAPVAKEVALESGKYGARRLVNKLKLGGKKKRRGGGGGAKRRRRRQKGVQSGGFVPLAALIPAATAIGKAAALGGTGAIASHAMKKLVLGGGGGYPYDRSISKI